MRSESKFNGESNRFDSVRSISERKSFVEKSGIAFLEPLNLKSPVFRSSSSSFPSTYIFLINLLVSICSTLKTCPHHLNLFSQIKSTIEAANISKQTNNFEKIFCIICCGLTRL